MRTAVTPTKWTAKWPQSQNIATEAGGWRKEEKEKTGTAMTVQANYILWPSIAVVPLRFRTYKNS